MSKNMARDEGIERLIEEHRLSEVASEPKIYWAAGLGCLMASSCVPLAMTESDHLRAGFERQCYLRSAVELLIGPGRCHARFLPVFDKA